MIPNLRLGWKGLAEYNNDEGGAYMSGRKNGTNRVAAQLGINPYGWGSGGKRKRPKGVIPPIGACKITHGKNCNR